MAAMRRFGFARAYRQSAAFYGASEVIVGTVQRRPPCCIGGCMRNKTSNVVSIYFRADNKIVALHFPSSHRHCLWERLKFSHFKLKL